MRKTNGVNQGHNAAQIHYTIKSAADRINVLKEEIGSLQDDIRKIKAEVKGQGIKMADFNAALRLYNLEADDLADSLTNIKLCFEALGIGGQGDLFPLEGERQGAAA